MNYRKKIVCLASSKKPGGRCVAGKEVAGATYGGWIRPISVRPTAEISLDERQYENGDDPEILDVIDIPMMAAAPRVHQTENHMIDSEYYWTQVGSVTWDKIDDMADTPLTLCGNGDSTYHGCNDRMTSTVAAAYSNSLWLIKPDQVTIRVLTPGIAFGNNKRRVRADFKYRSVHYNFGVTDPIVERSFLARENGDYPIAVDIYFCVSLAEAHTDNYCYKLVATIISENPL